MHITINNTISEINFVHKCFTFFANPKINDESIVHKICIVIDEVLTNIITHGYQDDSDHNIDISCEIESGKLVLKFKDDGIAFNPVHAKSEAIAVSDEMDKVGGLGIHLMRNLVDEISYERKNEFNHLVITKHVG